MVFLTSGKYTLSMSTYAPFWNVSVRIKKKWHFQLSTTCLLPALEILQHMQWPKDRVKTLYWAWRFSSFCDDPDIQSISSTTGKTISQCVPSWQVLQTSNCTQCSVAHSGFFIGPTVLPALKVIIHNKTDIQPAGLANWSLFPIIDNLLATSPGNPPPKAMIERQT